MRIPGCSGTNWRFVLREFESRLGRAAYESEGVAIFLGDSLAMMKELEGSVFPLTITSPPYNIGKEYEKTQPLRDYVRWCEQWIREIHRLASETGEFWLNLGYVSLPERAKAIPLPWLLWEKVPFYLVQEIIWNYGAGVAAKRSFSPRNEKFLWYVKDQNEYTFHLDEVRDPNVKYPHQKKNGKLKCNPLGKNPTDVWQIAKVTSGMNRSSKERTMHPAQFPVELIERIIRACSNPGDVVFDPFIGSGSVAEAALRCGRFAVGIEIEDKYIAVASKRLETFGRRQEMVRSQGELFTAAQG